MIFKRVKKGSWRSEQPNGIYRVDSHEGVYVGTFTGFISGGVSIVIATNIKLRKVQAACHKHFRQDAIKEGKLKEEFTVSKKESVITLKPIGVTYGKKERTPRLFKKRAYNRCRR